MTHNYRENRIAYVNSTRVVALDPVLFEGEAVTTLDPGEYIRFRVLLDDGTEHQSIQNAAYDHLFTNDRGITSSAWQGQVTCPATPGRLKILWEIAIGSAVDFAVDYIEVIDLP